MVTIEIFTDGCSLNNQDKNKRVGGFGYVMRLVNGKVIPRRTGGGGKIGSTNNEMELTAVISALKRINSKFSGGVEIKTDSKYIVGGINEWIADWRNNGWQTKSGTPVQNKNLWNTLSGEKERLEKQGCKVDFSYIPREDNNEADNIARDYAYKIQKESAESLPV